VALLTTILLAVFVVPPPWGIVLVGIGAAIEVAEAWGMLWWSRRRRAVVGSEAMVGAEAVALGDGWVRVGGERWRARSDGRLLAGDRVEVVAVDGLTVVVRRRRCASG
jgi:membrane-bound serine protease (ClpP class)